MVTAELPFSSLLFPDEKMMVLKCFRVSPNWQGHAFPRKIQFDDLSIFSQQDFNNRRYFIRIFVTFLERRLKIFKLSHCLTESHI